MGQAVRYGDASNSYIRVILEELKAFHEGAAPSAFDALLAEPETELEALRKTIAAAEQAIYDGLEGLPLDRTRGAVPSWVELIEDGRCADYTVSTDFKKSFLMDTGNRLQELVNRNDQRLARAGAGKDRGLRPEPTLLCSPGTSAGEQSRIPTRSCRTAHGRS